MIPSCHLSIQGENRPISSRWNTSCHLSIQGENRPISSRWKLNTCELALLLETNAFELSVGAATRLCLIYDVQ